MHLITKCHHTAELLLADLRDLHKSACTGPDAQPMLELVSRQLLRQCAELRQQINETRAALVPDTGPDAQVTPAHYYPTTARPNDQCQPTEQPKDAPAITNMGEPPLTAVEQAELDALLGANLRAYWLKFPPGSSHPLSTINLPPSTP